MADPQDKSKGSSLDDIFGEIDETLGGEDDGTTSRMTAGSSSSLAPTTSMGDASLTDMLQDVLEEGKKEKAGATAAVHPASVTAAPTTSGASASASTTDSSSLDELLKATGLGGEGCDDDDFDDIFGGAESSNADAMTTTANGGAVGTAAQATAAAAAAAGGGSGGAGAWKELDASERQDFLKWLEEDDVTQGLDALKLTAAAPPPTTTTIKTNTTKPASASVSSSMPPPLPPTPPSSLPTPKKKTITTAVATISSSSSSPMTASPRRPSSPPFVVPSTPEEILARIRSMLGDSTEAAAATAATAAADNKSSSSTITQQQSINPLHLKLLCAEYPGGIPPSLRPSLWFHLLPPHQLLCGQFQQQQEEGEREGGEDGRLHHRHQVPNSVLIRRDAAAVARALLGEDEGQDEGGREGRRDVLGQAIEKGLVFYCRQLRVDYEPEMGAAYGALALALLRGGREGGKEESAEVLGRFSTLCAWLVPYLLLSPRAREGYVRKVHAEFRLLLTYHAPLLVQHLDRGRPGWELPPSLALESSSSSFSWGKQEQARQEAEVEDIVGALEGRWSCSSSKQQQQQQQQQQGGSEGSLEVERLKVMARNSSTSTSSTNAATDALSSAATTAARPVSSSSEGGIIPTSWLLGHFLGTTLLSPPPSLPSSSSFSSSFSSSSSSNQARQDKHHYLLSLLDGCLLRGDRFLGLFLTAALLLRLKTDLLSQQGPALRSRLDGLVSGAGAAGKGGGVAQLFVSSSLPTSSSSSSSAMSRWLEEAERLDRTTPLSFRVHLTALEALARQTTDDPIPSAPPSFPPSSSSTTTTKEQQQQQQQQSYASHLVALTLPKQRAIDALQQDTPLPPSLPPSSSSTTDISTSTSNSTSNSNSNSSSSSNSNSSAAGTYKWALGSPERRRRQLQRDPDTLALLSTKLCLTVTPEEVVPTLCVPSSSSNSNSSSSSSSNSSLKFLALDCRSEEQVSMGGGGRFPTAYHLDPARLEDPEEITRLLTALEGFKGSMHLLLMGTGMLMSRSSIGGGGRKGGKEGGMTTAQRLREQVARAGREDLSHLHNAALFLLKRGFPYVSILEGGFVATHTFLLHKTTEAAAGGSSSLPSSSSGLGLSSLIDHVPSQCRMCKHEALLRFQQASTSSPSSLPPSSSSSSPAPTKSNGPRFGRPGGGGGGGGGAGGEPPSLAALSQLGQNSLDVLRSRATGLFGKLQAHAHAAHAAQAQAHAQAHAQAQGGGEGGREGGGLESVQEMAGSFLKGTVSNLTKRAEQAMQEARVKAQAAQAAAAAAAAASAAANAGGGGGGGGVGGGLSASLSSNATAAAAAATAAFAAAAATNGGRPVSANARIPSPQPPTSATATTAAAVAATRQRDSPSVFVIEDDEDEDEDEENDAIRTRQQQQQQSPSTHPSNSSSPSSATTTTTTPHPKSDLDREVALKQHALNGLQKGQPIDISPESLPNAQLFPVYKLKKAPPSSFLPSSPSSPSSPAVVAELPRFIVLTPERIIVLEEEGGSAGGRAGQGRVKSNHHLTELARMTFLKKTPDVVTLYFRKGGMEQEGGREGGSPKKEDLKGRAYRIVRKEEFIGALQGRLQRFK